MNQMTVELRFFASLREALGTAQERISIPAHVLTVGDLRELLRERGAAWADALGAGRSVRMAVNQQMTDASTPLMDGCEVAFFPPVTGG